MYFSILRFMQGLGCRKDQQDYGLTCTLKNRTLLPLIQWLYLHSKKFGGSLLIYIDCHILKLLLVRIAAQTIRRKLRKKSRNTINTSPVILGPTLTLTKKVQMTNLTVSCMYEQKVESFIVYMNTFMKKSVLPRLSVHSYILHQHIFRIFEPPSPYKRLRNI